MEVSKVLEMSHFKGLIIGKRRLDKILDDIKKKKKNQFHWEWQQND